MCPIFEWEEDVYLWVNKMSIIYIHCILRLPRVNYEILSSYFGAGIITIRRNARDMAFFVHAVFNVPC